MIKEGVDSVPVLHQLGAFDQQNEKTFEVQWTDAPSNVDSGMMLYTSGTTARPKGVLLREATLLAQAQSLHTAWHYQPSDRLLHILPLHHIHGTVNALLAPLLAGSTIEFMLGFNAEKVWTRLATPFLSSNGATDGIQSKAVTQPITFFTAVPTVWARMLSGYSSLAPEIQDVMVREFGPGVSRRRRKRSGAGDVETQVS